MARRIATSAGGGTDRDAAGAGDAASPDRGVYTDFSYAQQQIGQPPTPRFCEQAVTPQSKEAFRSSTGRCFSSIERLPSPPATSTTPARARIW